MVNRPDRVQIWSAQLAANDFPPICAMTGRPAETWRKFKFATPPAWAYALLLLACVGLIGLVIYAIVVSTIAQKASGFLPLTRSASRTVNLAIWVPAGLLIGGVVLWVAAAAIGLPTNDPTLTTIAAVLFWIGLLALIAGLVVRLVMMPLLCPRAKVMEPPPGQYDKLVELRNVHANFVAAVSQMHTARLSQIAGSN